MLTGPLRGWEGLRANAKSGAHNIDCARGSGGTPPENFEVLHALRCVLGVSEAPFCACNGIYTSCCLRLADSDQKYDVRGSS